MIKVKNIYYMLSYAYRIVNEKEFERIQTEEFDNLYDLMTAILIHGVTSQCKRGLHREYISHTEVTGSLRGKVNITDSVKQSTLLRKSMVCHYDDFSENVQLNQILKTTMYLLLRCGEVKKSNRKELRKLLLFFENVDVLELKIINWNALRYHRNNVSYKFLIAVCQLIIKGLLMTTDNGELKWRHFFDDQHMHQLYEKFLLGYFKKEYPQYAVSASYIEWNVDDGITDFLPAMQSDITITKGTKTIIIDAKYYGKSIQTHSMYNSKSIISSNLYQIFTYVKNKDQNGTGNVSGVTLYAKTDEEITPDNDYQMGGNKISVKTLDLGADWTEIVKQLDRVITLI